MSWTRRGTASVFESALVSTKTGPSRDVCSTAGTIVAVSMTVSSCCPGEARRPCMKELKICPRTLHGPVTPMPLLPDVDQCHPAVAPKRRPDGEQPAVEYLRHTHECFEQGTVARGPQQPRRHNREQMKSSESALPETCDEPSDLSHRHRLLGGRAAVRCQQAEEPQK